MGETLYRQTALAAGSFPGESAGADPDPGAAAEAEKLSVDLGRRHLERRVGDPIVLEVDATLLDLASALPVRGHQAGEREQPGDLDAAVPQLLGRDHVLRHLGGGGVVLEHPVAL